MCTGIIRRAIQLNNIGVCRMASPQSNSIAGDSFKQALKTLQELPQDAIGGDNDMSCSGGDSLRVKRSPYCSSMPESSLECEERVFIYRHPLLMELDCSRDNEHELLLIMNQACAVIIFNSALACHLHKTKEASTYHYHVAVTRYDMAVRLLTPFARDQSIANATCTWPHALLILALNNGAQIRFQELCSCEEARQMLDAVEVLIPSAAADTVDDDDSDDDCTAHLPSRCGLLSKSDLRGVIVNATWLRPPTAARAA